MKDEENIVADPMKNTFLTNIVKMGLEIEFENGVLPIHNKLIFFKVHCPNDVLNNLGNAFGVKCLQIARAEHIMSHKEREWINLIRKQYTQPLQYSSLERSLVVYMTLLNVPFGDRQNYIGLERLIKRKVVIDAYALHDGPYYIPQDATNINARQILFYNWAGISNILTRQPLNVVHEYFGPKIATYFAYYGLYNLFLTIASIAALTALFLAVFLNENYMEVRSPLCESYESICSDCPKAQDLDFCYNTPVRNFCNMYTIYILTDNKYTQYFATFIILWGVFLIAYWIGREKYLSWIWETQNKEYNKKQTRPEFQMHLETAGKSNKTGITMTGKSYYAEIINLICYIVVILLTVLVFSIFLKLRKEQDRDYIIRNNITKPETLIPKLIYTMIGFVIVLFIIDLILSRVAYIIVQKENHRTYESYSRSLVVHLYTLCFLLPMIVLGYFGFHSGIFKLYSGFEREVNNSKSYERIIVFNMCVMTSCVYELAIAYTIVLFLRFVILRKVSLYTSLTDYNQRTIVQNVPCWEREYILPPFKESYLAKKMTILVMQFTLIMSFGFASPPAIVIVLLFNMYDMRRDAELCTLHYRRPLLLKNNSFHIWTEILKLMVYLSIIVNVVSLVCSTDTIEAYLIEQRRPVGKTVLNFLELFFRHEHTKLIYDSKRRWLCCHARGFFHVSTDNFDAKIKKETILTIDELRTHQYAYIFIFEIIMTAIFKLMQYIFSTDVEELEIPKKVTQQQSEAKTLQGIT
ncbi:PREDICTED: anoctamin-9-like isoform X2 [Papilio xuthus]|nr:PREDICTED: anoctamin-9-like isoform X2 [Papilio xuthus]